MKKYFLLFIAIFLSCNSKEIKIYKKDDFEKNSNKKIKMSNDTISKIRIPTH